MSRISRAARAEQAGVRGDGAAQPDHPGVDVLLAQPRAVEPVVLGRRAEVPDVRVAAAGQERVAGHLVARPLADVGARDVADVVEVEQQDARPTSDAASAARARPEPVGRAADRRSSAPPSRRSSSPARRRRRHRGTPDAWSVHGRSAGAARMVRSPMLHSREPSAQVPPVASSGRHATGQCALRSAPHDCNVT